MPVELYQRMVDALALGKWPDGRELTEQQRTQTMDAVILWGQLHLPEDQRIGYIDKGSKAGSNCDDPLPLKWT
ncbi:MAG: DUF1315 family protein [Luminiphilus sp.]|nr:DUF1315 family protein [Luminiphilus sp.]